MLTRGSWHRFRALAAALSVLALVACGFHLQGKVELPRSLANARIEATDQQSDFYSSLRSSLTTAGANLDGPEANAAVIRILEDSSSERVLTVSGSSSRMMRRISSKLTDLRRSRSKGVVPVMSS